MTTTTGRARITLSQTPEVRRDFLTPALLARLAACGPVSEQATPLDHRDPASTALLGTTQVLVTGWGTPSLDADVLDRMGELRAVVHTGGTVRALLPDEPTRRGIRVSSQTEANARPVAEYTLAMIILAARGTLRAARIYRELRADVDRWAELARTGLVGARIGLVGVSTISRHLIRLLAPLDVEILVASSWLDDAGAAALGVTRLDLRDLLRAADVVSLHSAATSRTHHLIGASELALMRDGATLVNTARGALIDQQALVRELATGRLQAVLDVADPDVTPPDSPLWGMANVLLTPHVAGSVGTELHRLGAGAVGDVEAFVAGREMPGEIRPKTRGTMA